MGRKGANRTHNAGKGPQGSQSSPKGGKEGHLKLSPQKKNDLHKLIEKLLKFSSTIGATNGIKIFESHLDIDKILHKIIDIEEEINRELPERSEVDIEQLTSWMLENGARIDGVKVDRFDDFGYGLKATRDVKESDLLIAVPRKLMLTTDLAAQSELSHLMKTDTLLMHMPNIILALLLLVERSKGTASFWSPYIAALPSSYTTVLYFTPSELTALKGSPLFESSLKQCKNIARQYGYLYNLFQKSSDRASEILRDVFTYKQYRWAVSTVMTRQNLIPTRRPESPMILALIPFWDMGNHDNAKLTTDYNTEADQSEYFSCRDFLHDEQVFMSYGARPNADIFLHNGFVQLGNAADGIRLKLGISGGDPLGERRRSLLGQISVPHSGEFLLSPAPLEGKLLAFLRVFNMEKDQLENWEKNEKQGDLLHRDCAVDTSVENKMWQFLAARIRLLLAAYPTTLEEDERLLKEEASEMSPCLRLALLQRLSEKQILHTVLGYSQDHLKQ